MEMVEEEAEEWVGRRELRLGLLWLGVLEAEAERTEVLLKFEDC